ncbi:MAG: Gfo/Idh/MocA family oxidoreductase [Granulosicoccus sp.]|nr:Gfo/Idh/MocA family oxidoreductase [Granulosicoccus sp.]
MNTRIAVVGAGLVGTRHAQAVSTVEEVNLAAIVDPQQVGATLARQYDVAYYSALSELLKREKVDGVILATPNQMHVSNALECIRAGVPALVEKPLAVDLVGAEKIVAASEDYGVPILAGHHRRHNPLIARARRAIDEGCLGNITAVHGTTWFYKPDEYFDADWRKRPGAGPVYINLIHDIDLLRYLCGDVIQVCAMQSNVVRGNDVEDTAVVMLKFGSGALGTLSVSDCVAAPWSWELTARENSVYPATSETCYQIGGTDGSLALPNLALWQHLGEKSWWEPISATRLTFGLDDPLVRQVKQFDAVIRGDQQPLVSARDGLENQRVIEAVKQSAATGETIKLH